MSFVDECKTAIGRLIDELFLFFYYLCAAYHPFGDCVAWHERIA